MCISSFINITSNRSRLISLSRRPRGDNVKRQRVRLFFSGEYEKPFWIYDQCECNAPSDVGLTECFRPGNVHETVFLVFESIYKNQSPHLWCEIIT